MRLSCVLCLLAFTLVYARQTSLQPTPTASSSSQSLPNFSPHGPTRSYPRIHIYQPGEKHVPIQRIPVASSLLQDKSKISTNTDTETKVEIMSEGSHNIGLTRVTGTHEQMKSILTNLRLRQVSPSLLELGDIPLYQEVLKEKHLATYYGTIRIGDTLFRVLFDTGSCELWVPSSECSTARCRRHHRYPIEEHKFKYYKGEIMDIEYISGKVSGKLIQDVVTIGGLPVQGQVVGVAQTVDIELLDDVVWDGIVGLAYPSPDLVTKTVLPLFDSIMSKRLLSNQRLANQFAYYIDDTQGVMTLGGVNCDFVIQAATKSQVKNQAAIDLCKRSFQFVPVMEQTYWTIILDDVSLSYPPAAMIPIGTKVRGFCPNTGCKTIVDTGTYLVYTGRSFPVPQSWNTFSSCADIRLLPNITFHIRTTRPQHVVSLTLEPREYVLKFDQGGGRDECVVGISPDKDAMFTLGQVFLRAYYTLFDRDENRMGFFKVPRTGFDPVNAKPSISPFKVA